jgi:hypothetical protein
VPGRFRLELEVWVGHYDLVEVFHDVDQGQRVGACFRICRRYDLVTTGYCASIFNEHVPRPKAVKAMRDFNAVRPNTIFIRHGREQMKILLASLVCRIERVPANRTID